MKYEAIVAVDEETKKFMSFINEEISATISDGITGALRKTSSELEIISENQNAIVLSVKGISKTSEKIPSAIEQSQKKTELAIVNELIKSQKFHKDLNEDTKNVILTEQKIANEALLKSNSDLKEISGKANTYLLSLVGTSKSIEKIPSAIEESQEKAEQTLVSELLKNQQLHKEINEDTKAAILTEQKLVLDEITKLNDTYNENQVNILAKLRSFEEKLSILSDILDGQSHLLQRLEKIEGKVNDLKLPFYKRWFSKGVS